jgi:hypothetical protein
LGAIVFSLTAAAVAWLATSVGVALFVARTPASRFSGRPEDAQALAACSDDVRALLDQLTVRGEMVDPGAPPGGEDWQDLSSDWDRRWQEVGARCRFTELRDRGLGAGYDHLAWVHAELPEVHRGYVALLKSYFAGQRSRVDDLRRALDASRRELERQRAAAPARTG